jgi:hypothetical protein
MTILAKRALLILACGLWLVAEAAPTDFPHAVALRGCTQEDAPALEVYLTREPYGGHAVPGTPYLRVEIAWGDWQQLVGSDLVLVPLSRQGLAPQQPIARAELHLEQGASVWLRGTLRLTRVEVEQQVEGSYDFVGPDVHAWMGTFTALWVLGRHQCG